MTHTMIHSISVALTFEATSDDTSSKVQQGTILRTSLFLSFVCKGQNPEPE